MGGIRVVLHGRDKGGTAWDRIRVVLHGTG
jgi:hypothetical protein